MHGIVLSFMAFFSKAYGGGNHERAYSLLALSDGSFVMAGYTASFGSGNNDILVLKANADGSLAWARTFGGSDRDEAWSVIGTTDGGFAVAGHTRSLGDPDGDFILIKLTSGGGFSWARTIGGANLEEAYAVVQTSDGGFALAGVTNSMGAGVEDVLLVKLDALGGMGWAKTFGGFTYDYGYSVCTAPDGGIVLAGYTSSFGAGSDDFLVLKTDASGNLLWARTIGGPSYDDAYSVIPTLDGGFLVVGYTGSYGAGQADAFVVKLTSAGGVSWARAIGGTGWDEARSAIQTSDRGFLISGYTASWGAGGEAWLVKLTESGSFSWSKTFGGSGYEYAYDPVELSSGLGIAGTTWSYGAGNTDLLLYKTDAQGNLPGCVVDRTPTVNSPNPSSSTPSGFATQSLSSVSANPSQGTPSILVNNACVPVETEEWDRPPASFRALGTRGAILFEAEEQVGVRVFSAFGSLIWEGIVGPGSARVKFKPGVYFWEAGTKRGVALVM